MSELDIIRDVLSKYNPLQAVLYGSRATGRFKSTSDYDIMVFFKKSMFKEFRESKYSSVQERDIYFQTISNELRRRLGKPVDLVVMKYQQKWVDHSQERDTIFLNNIQHDGKLIFGGNNGIELCEMSEIIGLYKS